MKGASTTKTGEVVSLQSRESGANEPGEFVIAAVDEQGKLHQYGGVDPEIAAEVIGICANGQSLVLLNTESAHREAILRAQAEGEVPDTMPRNIVERYGAAPRSADELADKPQGMGQRPVATPEPDGVGFGGPTT